MGHEIRSKYRIIHIYIQRIHHKLPFMLSNKIELFERMQSLGLHNAISTYMWLYIAWLWPCIVCVRICKQPFTNHSIDDLATRHLIKSLYGISVRPFVCHV